MTAADRERWDAKYAQQPPPTELLPPAWLVRHAEALRPGRALDLATGQGHAAIWLAERGWDVTALDISPIGLQAARHLAERRGVTVNWVVADLDVALLGDDEFDLVTVFRFLDRLTLPSRIAQALRAGGHLIYQTFLRGDSPDQSSHTSNPAFTLARGELPKLFPEFEILHYEEQFSATEGLASLVARKP